MKTYENILKAITGESVARNKYTFFASEARKKILNVWPEFLKKRLITKEHMPKSY